MINPSSLVQFRSRRTNFLSVGVTLCALITAICVAPLAWLQSEWMAIWLLGLVTVLVLGTFGIWAFHAIKNPHLLDTENHIEQMAAISVLGENRTGKSAIIESIVGEGVSDNPRLSSDAQL